MANTTTDLPPMLARMAPKGPRCTFGGVDHCSEPAVAEVATVWDEHGVFDRSLSDLARLLLRPVCEEHLEVNQDIYLTATDRPIFLLRKLS